MEEVSRAQNLCNLIGINSTDIDILMELTDLPCKTIKNALTLLEKKNSVPYDVRDDAITNDSSGFSEPEKVVLKEEAKREMMEICQEKLDAREKMLLQALLNEENMEKGHISYDKMMKELPESDIQQIKKDVSRLFVKLRKSDIRERMKDYL